MSTIYFYIHGLTSGLIQHPKNTYTQLYITGTQRHLMNAQNDFISIWFLKSNLLQLEIIFKGTGMLFKVF